MAINFLNTAIGTSATFTGVVTLTDRLVLSDSLKNSFIGENTGVNNTTGDENIGLGYNSLFSNTTGGHNTAIGKYSLYSNISGSYNIAIGQQALYSSTSSSSNIGIGFLSLYTNSSGFANIGLGERSLQKNTTGSANIGIGQQALWNNTTGGSNTALGVSSLIANTTGDSNTAFGSNSLVSNTTGSDNVAMGIYSGKWIADGSTPNSTSENSIFIGKNTKANANSETNQIVIGGDAIGNGSNTVTLGNDSVVKTILKGTITAPSYGAGTLVTDAAGNITASSGGGAGGPFLPLSAGSGFPLTGALTGTSATFTGTVLATNLSGTNTGDQDLSGYLLNTTDTLTGTLIVNGGTGVSSFGTLLVQQNGDGSGSGITLTSSNAISHRIWKGANGSLNIGPSSLPSSFVQTTTGNVGIGTTSPDTKLTIENASAGPASSTYATTASNANLHLSAVGVPFYNHLFMGIGSASYAWIQPQHGNGNAQNLALNPIGGNVGIGTTAPTARLHVKELSGNTSQIKMSAASNEANYGYLTMLDNTVNTAKLTFGTTYGYNTQVDAMTIFNGNVGIGTDSPDTKLHIADSTSPIFTFERLDTTTIANEVIGQFNFKSTDSTDTGVNASIKVIKQDLPVATVPMAITFETGVSGTVDERMRIDSTGNVGIGATNPGEKLTVSGNGRFSNGPFGTLTIKHNYGYQQPNWGIKLDGNTGTTGGYLSQYINLGGFALEQGGTYYGGGPWRTDANSTSYSSVNGLNGQIVFYTNASLTANTTFNPAERMRITSDGTVDIAAKDLIIDDVNEHREEFTATGNQSISFDVDMKSIGASGQPFEVFVGWTHYSTGYGASLHQAFFQRSTAQSNITLIHTYFQQASSNGGSWGVFYINATTIRVTKTAGTHSGSGYGYLRVTQLKP